MRWGVRIDWIEEKVNAEYRIIVSVFHFRFVAVGVALLCAGLGCSLFTS